MAFVICCVFFTDLMRRRMSKRFGIGSLIQIQAVAGAARWRSLARELRCSLEALSFHSRL